MPPRKQVTTVSRSTGNRRSRRQPRRILSTSRTTVTRLRRTQRRPRGIGRQLTGRNALTALGGSSRPLSSRTARNTISASNRTMGDRIRITGSELIGSVVVPEGGDVQNCLLYQRYNNADPPTTRVASYAALFERWHPRKYTYRFIPSVPTGTQAGSYVFGQIADPTRLLTSGDSGLASSLRVVPGSMMKQYWQPGEAHLPNSRDYTSLWTVDPDSGAPGPSDRLDIAGQVALVTVTPGNVAAGTAIGAIELDYDIEFYVPRLSNSSTSRKTTIRLTRTEAKARGVLPPSGETVGVSPLNGMVNSLRTEVSKAAMEAVQQAIKNFVTPSLLPPVTNAPASPTPLGFPPGSYTFTFSLFTNTPPTTTVSGDATPNNSWLYGNPNSYPHGVVANGVSYYNFNVEMLEDAGGYPILQLCRLENLDIPPGIPDPDVNFVYGHCFDPLGNEWKWGETYSIEFAATSNTERCFADAIMFNNPELTGDVPSDSIVFCSLSVAADHVVWTSNSSSTAPTRKSVPICVDIEDTVVPQNLRASNDTKDVKSESKDVKLDTSSNGSEVEVVFAPRYKPPPSTRPGGSLYKPGASPRFVPSTTSQSSTDKR